MDAPVRGQEGKAGTEERSEFVDETEDTKRTE